MALQGPAAISSSLRSAFSVESQQLEINSQLAPNNPLTSGRPPTTATSATRFTRTIVVPVVEATKTTSTANVYFIGESNGTTTWLTNFTPHESMTIGITTVTLSPVPSASGGRSNGSIAAERATRTNTLTSTATRRGSLPSATGGLSGPGNQGWNSSMLDLATAPTSGYSTDGNGMIPPSSFSVVTIRRSSAIATTTVRVSSSPTSGTLPTDAYGSTANITFPTVDHYRRKRSVDDTRRKAVCEWVTATIRGTPVSWPNNWDGSKTVNCATASTLQQQPTPCKRC